MKTNARILLLAGVVGLSGLDASAQQAPGVTVDKEKKEVLVPCRISPRKMPNLPEIYPIEVVATWPQPKGAKAHETVVNFDVKPSDVHKALESLGLKAGKPVRGEDGVATGAELEIFIELADKSGAKKRLSIESVLIDRRTGRPFPALKWLFTGSSMKQVDPAKPDLTYAADLVGTLVGIYPVTDELVVQSNLTMKEEGTVKIEIGKGLLPPEGSPAVLVLKPAGPRPSGAAAPIPARAAAEAEVLKITQRMALTNAPRAVLTVAAPPPTAGPVDPLAFRRDADPGKATIDEARPVALPLPPVPPAK